MCICTHCLMQELLHFPKIAYKIQIMSLQDIHVLANAPNCVALVMNYNAFPNNFETFNHYKILFPQS